MQIELVGGQLDGCVIRTSHGFGFVWVEPNPPFRTYRDSAPGRSLYMVSRRPSHRYIGTQVALFQPTILCSGCSAFIRRGTTCPMCGLAPQTVAS